MRMRHCSKRKLLAVIAILAGALILLFIVPFWIWLALLGFALIITGLFLFLKPC